MATHGGYDEPTNLGVLEPEDILSPQHYTAVRNGGLLMRALPLWCYTSERFHEAEKEESIPAQLEHAGTRRTRCQCRRLPLPVVIRCSTAHRTW